jgi:hypothetical protein
MRYRPPTTTMHGFEHEASAGLVALEGGLGNGRCRPQSAGPSALSGGHGINSTIDSGLLKMTIAIVCNRM